MDSACSIYGAERGHTLCNITEIFVGLRVLIESKELATNSTTCKRISKIFECSLLRPC
jgi:hypothetical protein